MGELKTAGSQLARTVEVFVTRIACLDKRFDDAINERMLRPSTLDGKRPVGAMKLTGTSLIGFGLDEVRQELFLVGPPIAPSAAYSS